MNPAWQRARHILCVRLDSMGDVLMTSPAFRALKAASQQPRLTLLTSPSGAAVASLIPEIDEVIVYHAPWMKTTAPPTGDGALEELISRLRNSRLDAAVIFTVYSQSPLPAALLTYMAGIPLRLAHCRENPYHLLSDWLPEPEPQEKIRHEVRRHLDLVAAAGFITADERLSLRVSREAVTRIRGLLPEDDPRPLVTLHPGATAASRRYPVEQYAEAIRHIHRRTLVRFAVTGSAEEAHLAEEIQMLSGVPVQSFAGRLTLEELAAIIQSSQVLLTNNTGPAHIAAAVGTPIVELYALTNPQHTPWQVPCRLLYAEVSCRFCYKSICPQGHHHCLRQVPPMRVADAVMEMLGGASAVTEDLSHFMSGPGLDSRMAASSLTLTF